MYRLAKLSHLWMFLRGGRNGLVGLLSLLVFAVHGGVPLVFQFQGHITDNGAAVEGQGFFKFSLVEAAGTGSEQVVWSNNDVAGAVGEPTASVELTVERGVYSVPMGDATIANMVAIPSAVFDNDALSLRVWYSADGTSFSQLSPDLIVQSVVFAIRAGSVDAVAESALPASVAQLLSLAAKQTYSSSTDSDAELLGAGFQVFREFSGADWQSGPAGEPAVRSDHVGVWTGTEFVIWSGMSTGASPLGTGSKYNPTGESWNVVSTVDTPSARWRAEAVWTGSRMFVWGGFDGTIWDGGGGSYDPSGQRWYSVAAAPIAGREDYVMAWTGSLAAIWGGKNGLGFVGDGAVYDPSGDQWTAIPALNAPSARQGAAGVWDGTQLMVWGGRGAAGELSDGARLAIPASDSMSWSSITATGAPDAREGHTAVWTGSRMLVWGGTRRAVVDSAVVQQLLATGGSYDPVADAWTPLSVTDAPTGRIGHQAIWTGEEMLILFGTDDDGETSSAHAYNPDTDTWRTLPSGGNPPARTGAVAVWTGSEVLVFGGEVGGAPAASLQTLDPTPPVFLYRKP